jgi:hypothetical protein
VAGGTETFRLERAGVNTEQLSISEAFIERVHRLDQAVRTIKIGVIDEEGVGSLVGWDGGELYGTWPVRTRNGNGFRLADAVLHLAWITPVVTGRASREAGWTEARRAADVARAAAGRLAAAAERLVRVHVAHMDALSQVDAEDAVEQLFWPDSLTRGWGRDYVVAEIRRFREVRALAAPMPPGVVAGIDEMSAVGLREDLKLATWPASGSGGGTGMTALAGFAAMWHLGLWPAKRRSQLEQEVCADPTTLTSWLGQVAAYCDEAAAWLADDVLVTIGEADVVDPVDLIEEFLNLPLWRQRLLLYEVWVLCATLDASERAGWLTDLRGLIQAAGVWVLPVGPAANPVATLRLDADPAVTLDVWREPSRVTNAGMLTPDVTVSTPGEYPRDLLVVEAKDRLGMSVRHRKPKGSGARSGNELKTALGVARRYAAGLHPRATWVCNHCDFREKADATVNHGDVWTRIHVAERFRPDGDLTAFTESVSAALAPPPDARPPTAAPEGASPPGH